ncbi:MAG: tRNA threonylcarbamoyladenosine dehydratase [Clostridiales bacterium]|nr:tRNA threonylcarbamoyladenosine dehydratase [Clostridiales bacterium]
MKESFYRTAMLLGEDAEGVLKNAHAAVFGVGGVGGHACDALCRCGVGRLTVVDFAVVKESNLNRQICAEKQTVGLKKVEAIKRHIEAVSDAVVFPVDSFVTADNASELVPSGVSVVIDAVDNVTAKLALISYCVKRGVPVISSMGAGNRLDPTRVKLGDIYKTSVDPLARVMRRELKARGIKKLTVAWSDEEPTLPVFSAPDPDSKKPSPGSVPFVPAAFGLALASEAVRIILKKDELK